MRILLRSTRDEQTIAGRVAHTLERALTLVTEVGKRVQVRENGAEQTAVATRQPPSGATAVFLDLDTVLLDKHPGKYGPELSVQADISAALMRLSEVVDKVVVVVNPKPADGGHVMDTDHRLEVLRTGLGSAADSLLIATCRHGADEACDCAKPGNGLIRSTLQDIGVDGRAGWYISADQEGMVAGRTAGLQTIRIGPMGEDHLSAVHRPDFEARDLMDGANRILLETLAAD